jgi:glycosyltransferase involved in cell wall biosynthesis
MRILMINKYHHITGGADTYYFQLSNVLRTKGHDVIEFCMRHPKNVRSEFSNFFVSGLTHENWKNVSMGKKIRGYANGIYNLEAKSKIRLLVEKTKPDVAHIHNIFYQISPSVFDPLRRAGIPIVQTLHDYQIVCGSNNLYCKGRICEDCFGKRYYNILLNRCYNDRFSASFLAFSAKMIHMSVKMYDRKIDMFISASQFLKDKVVSQGIEKSKVVVLPYPIDFCDYEPNYDCDDYVVFVGRFVKHKGIMTLVRAFETLGIKLLILGDGELQREIEDYIRIRGFRNVELKGFLRGRELQEVVKRAKFVILPSEWYEVLGIVALEAFALGKPVVASRIGGIPELVTESVGLLFEPGNVRDLVKKVATLYDNDDLIRSLGRNARKRAERFYNVKNHYQKIIGIYRGLGNARS